VEHVLAGGMAFMYISGEFLRNFFFYPLSMDFESQEIRLLRRFEFAFFGR
jgi:hypothetical protein